MSMSVEYYQWTQDEKVRRSIPIRASKRVNKTHEMRDQYRKGLITEKEYRSHLEGNGRWDFSGVRKF
jgi:hypothetical protein